ncbi:MAG TPA: hypothetical protein VKZ43_01595 [Trueperaceae bacterium]|nr:hypothetical protein [Trueperaceae bacterium]
MIEDASPSSKLAGASDTLKAPVLAVERTAVSVAEVLRNWLPLATSWLVMGLELPIVSAVMARLADPEINLAAYGGVTMPVALLIEAPIMMLLSASTALGRDLASYRLMHRFMMGAGLALTLIHAAFAFTPLFDLVLVPLLGAPDVVTGPARLGLQVTLPWTWAIAHRRYHQGILIRFGRSRHVSFGTVVRVIVMTTVALTAALLGAPGIVAAGLAITSGVLSEAVYCRVAVSPVLAGPLAAAASVQPPLDWSAFRSFYIPLALTSVVSLLMQPLGSAAISRMPDALPSLAVWPVVGGLLFMFRSLGFALNEVVVALLDRPAAFVALRRFALLLTAAITAAVALIAFTPLSRLWFGIVSGLGDDLMRLATVGFAFALLWPGLDVLRNLLQGVIVHGRRTRIVTESMVVFLVVSAALLAIGTSWRAFPALPYAMTAFVAGTAAQVGWLWWRSRGLVARWVEGHGKTAPVDGPA